MITHTHECLFNANFPKHIEREKNSLTTIPFGKSLNQMILSCHSLVSLQTQPIKKTSSNFNFFQENSIFPKQIQLLYQLINQIQLSFHTKHIMSN